jgi:TRAP transporter 4TM/12TM fusion protein
MTEEKGWKQFSQPGAIIAIVWSCFQIYVALTGFMHPMILYPIHAAFAVALAILSKPLGERSSFFRGLDSFLVVLALGIGVYAILSFDRISTRIPFVQPLTTYDYIAGIALVLLLMEVCRRTVGYSLTIIAMVFIVYAFGGKYIPGLLGHRGMSLTGFIDLQTLSPNGIYGLPIGVSAELVFYFILFGAFLEKGGGGELFSDLGFFATGKFRGGAAKVSVVSSALYGTISGSAVANVVVDGMFTIPMMKRSGFKGPFAAAVEAVASTGGQIMPPVMGAAAFILAQIIGVSYWKVAAAAAIPAVLYYVALYAAIDFKAMQEGLLGLPKSELPDVRSGLKMRIHLLIPLILMVYYIISFTVSPIMAAIRAIAAVFLVGFLRRATWMGPTKVLGALEKGARESVTVAIPCAVAGLIIGVVIYSGLGLKFTELMIVLSGGKLFLALILVMLAVIVLGMGMPTSAAYLIAAIMLAPMLIKLGTTPLAAHMFIFYFAVISMITPPVALAAFAAAAISESDLWETGIQAFKIAIPGFLIPYVFVYNTSLLLEGPLWEIIWRTFVTIVGITALAGSVIGFFMRRSNLWERLVLLIGALLLIIPEMITDFLGIAFVGAVFLIQRRRPSDLKARVPATSSLALPAESQEVR